MSELDVSTWKKFQIGDLFEVEKHGKAQQVPTGGMIAKNLLVDGTTPRITVTGTNNGVIGYYADIEDKNYRVYENFISVSFLGTVFYHSGRASLDMKVHCLKPCNHQLNSNTGTFLVTIIQKAITDCSYAAQVSSTMLPDITIILPATPSGDPDWAYMDSFMGKILEEEESSAKQLVALAPENAENGHFLDASGWKAFRIGELFDILLAKGDIQPKQVADGPIPLVSAGNEDNGIVAFIDEAGDGMSEIFPAGCITVSMFGKAFYQPEHFYAVSHGRVNILQSKTTFSSVVGTFLAACLSHELENKYDYATMCTQKKLTNEVIYLPVTSDGQPDWAWMEQYMQQQLDKTEKLAEHLNELN